MTTSYTSTLKFLLTAIGTLLVLIGQAAVAQDQPSLIEPSKQHELLKQDVGTWDATIRIWPMAGAEPLESKGVEKNQLLKGGMWLITHFEGEAIGMPFVGMGTTGYDPAEKKYVGTWVDTMTPHMMITKSDYDEKTKTMTGQAETRDAISGEKYTAKIISRHTGDDTRVMEMHRKDENGKEWKVMEISYKRSKK